MHGSPSTICCPDLQREGRPAPVGGIAGFGGRTLPEHCTRKNPVGTDQQHLRFADGTNATPWQQSDDPRRSGRRWHRRAGRGRAQRQSGTASRTRASAATSWRSSRRVPRRAAVGRNAKPSRRDVRKVACAESHRSSYVGSDEISSPKRLPRGSGKTAPHRDGTFVAAHEDVEFAQPARRVPTDEQRLVVVSGSRWDDGHGESATPTRIARRRGPCSRPGTKTARPRRRRRGRSTPGAGVALRARPPARKSHVAAPGIPAFRSGIGGLCRRKAACRRRATSPGGPYTAFSSASSKSQPSAGGHGAPVATVDHAAVGEPSRRRKSSTHRPAACTVLVLVPAATGASRP